MEAKAYLGLSWSWADREDRDEGYWIVTIAELPDFFAAGDTRVEAYANAREALLSHLSSYIATGTPIPTPPANFRSSAKATTSTVSQQYCMV
jgi:predicted RNase H-like HicB family nuclease